MCMRRIVFPELLGVIFDYVVKFDTMCALLCVFLALGQKAC